MYYLAPELDSPVPQFPYLKEIGLCSNFSPKAERAQDNYLGGQECDSDVHKVAHPMIACRSASP